MDYLVGFFLSLVLTAVIIYLVSALNLGATVTGFGTALTVAVVIAAFGLLWDVTSIAMGWIGLQFGVLANWLGAAVIIWAAGKFVPGFTVTNFLRALLVALVMALMHMAIVAIVGMF